jgi:hypothetical protein
VTSQLGLRGGLRRLSTALIAYGGVGLAVAAIGLVALVWASLRISALTDTVDREVGQLTTTLERTAKTLHDASDSADAFSFTLDRTPPSVRQSAATIRNLRPNLQAVETQLSSINILGSQPLADAARLFGQMASDLEGLDTRLDQIADDLDVDRDTLRQNATSLDDLGDRTSALSQRIRAGFVQSAFGDLGTVFVLTMLVFVGWTAVPAVGALALGVWLRRTLVPEEAGPT